MSGTTSSLHPKNGRKSTRKPAQGRAKKGKKEKVWVEKARKEPPEEAVISRKAAAMDARVRTKETLQAVGNELSTIVINTSTTPNVLYGVAIGVVANALGKGYLAYAPDDTYPYLASVYLQRILAQFATGATPIAQQLPSWLLALGRAISPKNVPFQAGGKVNYLMETERDWTAASPVVLNYPSYGISWLCTGPKNVPSVNAFPATPPYQPPYDDSIASEAFQNLCQFMAADQHRTKETSLVPISNATKWDKNVSAFAVAALQMGDANSSLGGICYQAQLEVPIFTPLLTKFVNPSVNTSGNRNYNYASFTGGDTIFLGHQLSYSLLQAEYEGRRNPRFHFVDFNEFVDVLAKWVGLIQSAFMLDVEKPPAATLSDVICPLTFQEMKILLRHVCITAFKASQAGVQGIMPRHPTAPSDSEFVPFTYASNTCSLCAAGMIIPSAMIENLRTLVYRKFVVGKKSDIVEYIPVLGAYFGDNPDENDYKFQLRDDEGNLIVLNSFSVGEAIYKSTVKDKHGKMTEVLTSEVPIRMWDGSYNDGFVFINDPNRIQELTEMWNGWINSSGLLTYSSKTGQFSTELGIKSLASVCMTRVIAPSTAPTKTQYDVRRDKRKISISSTYSTRFAIADISQGRVLAAPWEQVQSIWVLPTLKMGYTSNPASNAAVQKWQQIVGEPHLVPRVVENEGISLDELHATYAAKLVKGKFAQESDWDVVLREAEEQGRGGILSGIGKALDSVFGF